MKGYGPPNAMEHPRFGGIRTFMRLPQVDDLRGVNFAVVGIPFDTGATYRVGARFGPEAIRAASMLLRPYNPALDVSIFERLSGVDVGDISVVPGYLPESHARIAEQMARILDEDVVPVGLGGDHSVTLAELRAVAKRHGPVALIQLDAHGDVWRGYFGHKDTHGTPFRRAVEEGLLDVARSTQIGLRGSLYGPEDLGASRDLGFEVFTTGDVRGQGVASVGAAARDRAGDGPCFITVDIDVVDPAFAPATGTPEVGGLTSWDSLELIRAMAGVNLVACDLVEVSPAYDTSGQTTGLLAATLVYELISLLALGRQNESEQS